MAWPPSLFCGEESRLSWSVLGCDRIELSYVEYGTTHTLTSDGEDASLNLPEGSLAAMPSWSIRSRSTRTASWSRRIRSTSPW
jgi:hypothetical protein